MAYNLFKKKQDKVNKKKTEDLVKRMEIFQGLYDDLCIEHGLFIMYKLNYTKRGINAEPEIVEIPDHILAAEKAKREAAKKPAEADAVKEGEEVVQGVASTSKEGEE